MSNVKLSGCMNLVARMHEDDQRELLDRLDRYQASGVPAHEAQRMAARDTLAEVTAEHDELMGHMREQHPDLFEPKNTPEQQAKALAAKDEPLAAEGPFHSEAPAIDEAAEDAKHAEEPAAVEPPREPPPDKLSPEAEPGRGAPAPRAAVAAQKQGKSFMGKATEAWDLVLNKVLPMSEGRGAVAEVARAIAKNYANAERMARYQWQQFDHILTKNYDEATLTKMYDAADEEGLIRGGHAEAGPDKGLNRLTPDQRATVETLHMYGEELLQRARQVGMFNGEALPYWVPRIAALIDEDGNWSAPIKGTTVGHDVTTSAPSMKERRHLFKEDTEQGMKGVLGDNAKLVNNIRTMPLAMARLERAIAGRELINRVKDTTDTLGLETIVDGRRPGYVEIPGVAFRNYSPKLTKDPRTGRMVRARDQFGQPMYEQQQLWVLKDFEGPLKAITYVRGNAITRPLMDLKAAYTSLIMYSPMIHNQVILGKAFPSINPIAWSKLLFKGNALRQDVNFMRKMIGEGGVQPISARGGALQDITGIAEDPQLKAGRSMTAKVLSAPVGLVSKSGAESVKRAVDAAGKFWHQTLLWDRVASVQAGMFDHMEKKFTAQHIAAGMDPGAAREAAIKTAGHMANRFGGTLTNESMSAGARVLANATLFSRTFTLGNAGLVKDAVRGLPVEIRAQLEQTIGALNAKSADHAYQRKAMQTLVMDLAVSWVINSLAQNAADATEGTSFDKITEGYVRRYTHAITQARLHPIDTASHPIDWLKSFGANSENEPGKENRIHSGSLADGTGTYFRLPFGKMGEDLEKAATDTMRFLRAKANPVAGGIADTVMAGLGSPLDGRQIWLPSDSKMAMLGKIVAHIGKGMIPLEEGKVLAEWTGLTGPDNPSPEHKMEMERNRMKAWAPFAGFTISKGYPHGPAVGELAEIERTYGKELSGRLPDIKKLIATGDPKDHDEAVNQMRDAPLNMKPEEIAKVIKSVQGTGLSSTRISNDARKGDLERFQAARDRQ